LLIRVEELDNWKRKLRIGLPETAVQERIDELFGELAKRAEMPGFRRGKVPRDILERKHGGSIKAEAIESLLGGAYAEAIQEAGLRPLHDPTVEELDESPSDGQYLFVATVEVRPEIDLKDYEGLPFTERVPIITNDDVDRALDELREGQAELAPVARPSVEGDYVTIDYTRVSEDGEPIEDSKVDGYPCEVGKGGIPPELDQALLGVNPGDEKKVTVTYPDDHHVEALAGKTIPFLVAVKDVNEKRLPPVDDDLARRIGRFETLLDLRVKIRSSLEAEAKAAARRRLEEEIVAELVKRHPFALPESLVEDRIARMLERLKKSGQADGKEIDESEFRGAYLQVVEHQLRSGLILGALAEKHGIEVKTEELEARVALIAEQHGREPADLMKDLKDTDALSRIEDDIWLAKVHDLIVGFSNVTTEEIELPRREPSAASSAGEA